MATRKLLRDSLLSGSPFLYSQLKASQTIYRTSFRFPGVNGCTDSHRQFSVFNEFSNKIRGEATSNPEFQQSVKELKQKAYVNFFWICIQLVNYVLNAQHGKRIAVILNEFCEEIGVERAMINEGEGGAMVEEWVELANGCVCCTVKHSLVQALEQLIQRKERLDHILLETTGLADPAPLASILWLDDQLESSVKLDSIITVVDAKNLPYQLNSHKTSSLFPEAYNQLAFADVVILNKVDLVSSKDIQGGVMELEKEIHCINSLAKIIPSVRCQVDLSVILDCSSYDGKHASHFEAFLKDNKSLSTRGLHDSGVRTLCLSEPGHVDLDKVREWIEEILWEKKHSMDFYRCKGVLNVHGSDYLHTLQGVREIYEIVPARKWLEEENRVNKIVFIRIAVHSYDKITFLAMPSPATLPQYCFSPYAAC